MDSGFQVIQGLVAFSTEGLFGVGIGKGLQKLQIIFRPAHTDYILRPSGKNSVSSGHLRFIFFLLWAVRACAAYKDASDPFLSTLVWAVSVSVLIPMFINLGGVLKLIPLAGNTSPVYQLRQFPPVYVGQDRPAHESLRGGEPAVTRLCIAAGGTGGHIFPAIAFAEWVLSNEPGVSISFVCGSRPMENEIYASRGYVPLCLPLSGSPFGARFCRLSQEMERDRFIVVFLQEFPQRGGM